MTKPLRPAPQGGRRRSLSVNHAGACVASCGAHAVDVLDLSSHARSPRPLRSRTHPARRVAVGAAVVLLGLVLCACTAGDPQFTADRPANFWLGLWHGAISWVALVAGIFVEGIEVYERDNTGSWYDFGFLLGATSIWAGGSSAGYHRRSRRSRRRDMGEADTIV